MPHNRSYDDIIIKQLYSNGKDSLTQIFNMLRCNIHTISKCTVNEHLNKMAKQGIIIRDDAPRQYNIVYYSLSDETRSKLRYSIFRGPKPKRNAVLSREERAMEEETERSRYAFLLLLLQAADGSARWKPVTGKLAPGCVAIPSSSSPSGSVMCSLKHEAGVVTQDLTEHKDVGNDGIFEHVNFAEYNVEYFIRVLKEDGLQDSLRLVVRSDQENKNGIGIEVLNERLKRLIDYIACLVSSVEDNIRYMWIYKKKPSSKSDSWDQKWYESFYGKERTKRVLMEARQKRGKIKKERNKEKKHEMIQYGEELFRLGGRGVVGIYHCEIICDKYEYPLHDEKRRNVYEKYREFVREVINKGNHKYSHLIHDLVDLVYPEPLRRLHNADPYLRKYVNNLPDKPLIQWSNIPII